MKQHKLTHKQTQELADVIQRGESTGPEVRRAQTILLVDKEADAAPMTAMTGYSRTHAFTLRRRYLHEGISAIQDKRKGRPKELLRKQQRNEIVATVKGTQPTDHGYRNPYWTTGILGDFIKRKYQVT